ncbi:hypothetical protein [Agromyces sp. H66]|uniref:hypothetical protein n=1 Tax=Agromyces sp. H66 TaxID=2529859 RepID=UPI001B7D7DF5|nr:hypothetical protein [Agromyces sp. H66]
MKRIGIVYGGREFSIGQEGFDRLKSEIEAAHRDGRAVWIRVNHGEGRPQPADLLVGPGIPIALLPIPDEPPTPADRADDSADHRADLDSASIDGSGPGADAATPAG